MKSSSVSVIMAAYNAAATIEQSITSALSQQNVDLELIVVDDCSTDDTVEIVRNLESRDDRIVLYAQDRNQGPATCRNKGVNNAEHELIAFLDADDLWHPLKLSKQLGVMNDPGADSRLALVYTWSQIIDSEDRKIENYCYESRLDQDVFDSMLHSNFIGTASSPLISKSALQKIGGFDPKERRLDDWQVYLWLAHQFTYALVPEVLTYYRLLPDSNSHAVDDVYRSRQYVLGRAKRELLRYNRQTARRGTAYLCLCLIKRAGRDKRLKQGKYLLLGLLHDPLVLTRNIVRQRIRQALRRRIAFGRLPTRIGT